MLKQNTSLWFVSRTLNAFVSGTVDNFNEEETLRCFTLCVFALPNVITLLTVSKAEREDSLYQTLCKDYQINSF